MTIRRPLAQPTEPTEPTADAPGAPLRDPGDPWGFSRRLPWVAPAATVLAGGWFFRWMSDDGFIYLRVVENLISGNGPVFNADERVEVATGPLWVALLAAARLITGVRLEWIAVVLGLGLAALGAGLAGAAAVRARGQGSAFWGVQAFCLIPFVWHFATSGLETGLLLAWIGLSAWLLVTASDTTSAGRIVVVGAVVGLGPLIRPDLALVTLVALAGLVWRRRRTNRPTVLLVVSASAAPVLYQVFRMAYYRAVVPNTALAKLASASHWDQGLAYLANALANPLVIMIILGGMWAASRREGPWQLRLLAFSGLVYVLAVTRGGGDFMRLRMYIPGLMLAAISAPLLRSVSNRTLVRLVLFLGMIGWLETISPQGVLPAPGVVSERDFYAGFENPSGDFNPITVEDFGQTAQAKLGIIARNTLAAGETGYWELVRDELSMPVAAPPRPVTVLAENVGLVGYAAGADVYIIDWLSITDPIGARLEATERGRPGHERVLPRAWVEAKAGIDSPGARLLDDAMNCGRPAKLLRGVSAPLTAELALDNLLNAVGDTFLVISPDPAQAREEACVATSSS